MLAQLRSFITGARVSDSGSPGPKRSFQPRRGLARRTHTALLAEPPERPGPRGPRGRRGPHGPGRRETRLRDPCCPYLGLPHAGRPHLASCKVHVLSSSRTNRYLSSIRCLINNEPCHRGPRGATNPGCTWSCEARGVAASPGLSFLGCKAWLILPRADGCVKPRNMWQAGGGPINESSLFLSDWNPCSLTSRGRV